MASSSTKMGTYYHQRSRFVQKKPRECPYRRVLSLVDENSAIGVVGHDEGEAEDDVEVVMGV